MVEGHMEGCEQYAMKQFEVGVGLCKNLGGLSAEDLEALARVHYGYLNQVVERFKPIDDVLIDFQDRIKSMAFEKAHVKTGDRLIVLNRQGVLVSNSVFVGRGEISYVTKVIYNPNQKDPVKILDAFRKFYGKDPQDRIFLV